MEKPFVSYCLTTYNQKKFVADAVRSALGQTYPNMEIVISDDASTDGTREIIRKLVEEYRRKGGKHAVRFLEHDENAGFSRNISACFGEARGELIIEAHDDDIARPDRAVGIVDAWLRTGKKATAIVHGWQYMDSENNILGGRQPFGLITPWEEISHDILWLRRQWPLGAAMAVVPDVMTKFEAIRELGGHDDCIWLIRAMMLGCPYYIPDRLVYYRIGSGASTSFNTARLGQKKQGERGVAAGKQSLIDLDFYREKMLAPWYPELVSLVKSRIKDFDNVRRCFTSDSFWEKFWLLATKPNLMMQCLPPRLLCAPIILLPKRWGDPILNWMSEVNWARCRKKIGQRVVVGEDGKAREERTR